MTSSRIKRKLKIDPVETFSPDFLVYLIIFLDAKSAARAASVSKNWQEVIKDPFVWKTKIERIGLEVKDNEDPKKQYNQWAQQYQLKRQDRWALIGNTIGQSVMSKLTYTDTAKYYATPGYYEAFIFYFFPNSTYAEQLHIERAKKHLKLLIKREQNAFINVGEILGSMLGFFAGVAANTCEEQGKKVIKYFRRPA